MTAELLAASWTATGLSLLHDVRQCGSMTVPEPNVVTVSAASACAESACGRDRIEGHVNAVQSKQQDCLGRHARDFDIAMREV